MAGFRRMFCAGRQAGHCYIAHPHLVYLHFLSYHGLAGNCVYDYGVLAQYQKLYSFCPPQSAEVFVGYLPVFLFIR